jgi:hypothetical protein
MRRQNLNRDCALQPGIKGAINLAHAACAKQTFDHVRSESRTREDCHLLADYIWMQR